MITVQKPLYPLSALSPHISAEQMDYHYNKHHKGYVNKLNQLLTQKQYSSYKNKDLEVVIKKSIEKDKVIYNNAAQIWNHDFFWKSMSPKGGGKPKGKLLETIVEWYGSWEDFRSEFVSAASSIFGSGWIWLVDNHKHGYSVEIAISKDAANFVHDPKSKPLLTLDVWEHAYYLDYKNNRAEFVQSYLDHVVNWKFAEKQFGKK